MKLDIGCGPQKRDGYFGVDIQPAPGVDLVCPAWAIGEHLPEGAVVEAIYSRHMLEHLTYEDAGKTLAAWRRVLLPGGTVEILVPDIAYHVTQLYAPYEKSAAGQCWTNLHHAAGGFYGWQRGPHDIHRSAWVDALLFTALHEAGFVDLARVHNRPWHLHVIGRTPC